MRRTVPTSQSAASFQLGPWRGVVEQDVEQPISTQLLPAPGERAAEGEVLRHNNYRVTSRVSVRGLGAVLVKVHRVTRLRGRLLSLVRREHAESEWAIGRHLYAQGLPVPRPLAYGERRRLGMLEGSFFAGEFCDDVKTLNVALTEDQPRRMRRALLVRTARLVRALHDRGFDHQDLHGGNILVRPGPGDVRGFVIVDLHRARVGQTVRARARARALGQWLHSLRRDVGPGGRLRLVRAYLGDGADRETVGAFYRRIERRSDRVHRIRVASRGRRCMKESTKFTLDVGQGRGARARDLPQRRLEQALIEHDEALVAADARVAKRGRRGSVTCHGDVVVKETKGAGALGAVKDVLAPDRHRAGYVNAHRLTVVDVPTARPLAYVRRGGRVFTIFEDVSTFPRLDHLARRLFASFDRAAKRRLLLDSADWLASLHRQGVYHGDLKGVNVRVDANGPTHRFLLIDTDRCRFSDLPVDTRRRIKNLAQLAASIPVSVTRTDRLRWFRRYALGSDLLDREQTVAQEVAKHLAQKIVVTDEPIE